MKNQKIYGIGDAGAYHLQVVSWEGDEDNGEVVTYEHDFEKQAGKSPIEARLAEILNLINPYFEMNQYVGVYEVDFLYEELKLVIEANGKAFHNPEKDARKESYLLKEGYLTVPITGTDIMNNSWDVYCYLKFMFEQLGFETIGG
jgi:very-short-patch-repair endonuclease